MAASGPHGKYLLQASGLALVIIVALTLFNAGYLFRSEVHETGDGAANTLSVIRASHGKELYGAYSRWGFRHPGPAVFYYFAALEGIFYRVSHLMRTPFNAQVLGTFILTAGFFSAAVGMAASWVRSRFFLPLTLLLATLHFSTANLGLFVTSAWPAYIVPLIFLCLLVAAASVGAGQGRDLPLLVTAGSLLIHIHVAQPLFVLPMFVLGYAGLAWSCRRAAGEEDPAGQRGFTPWRRFPRAHLWAAILAAVFLLPLVLDLFKGSRSNFASILAHMRNSHGVRQSWRDAVAYFLHFGVYKPSIRRQWIFAGGTEPGEIGRYLTTHLQMLSLWSAALLAPPLAFALAHRRQTEHRLEAAADAAIVAIPDRRRWRFLGWLSLVWFVSVILSLYWAYIMDGEMFYYNAWFNYSIYFVLALMAAAAVSDGLEGLSRRLARSGPVMAGFEAVCVLASIVVCVTHRDQVRSIISADSAIQARTVSAALRDGPDSPRDKLLVFDGAAWETATGVAVLLERAGYRPHVEEGAGNMFGDDLALERSLADLLRVPASGLEAMEIWHLLPAALAPGSAAERLLPGGTVLQVGGKELNPLPEAAVTFIGPAPNVGGYALYGWPVPSRAGDPYNWSVGKSAVLNFRPVAVPAGTAVEMIYDCFPEVFPGKQDSQRLGIYWNGTDLGTLKAYSDGPLRVVIPGALWNAGLGGTLVLLDFPDAISPSEIGGGADYRQLAFASRKITFRAITAPSLP